MIVREKSINSYLNVNYDLMINVQDRFLKHSNVVASPITDYMLLVKDEETAKIFYSFFIILILLA